MTATNIQPSGHQSLNGLWFNALTSRSENQEIERQETIDTFRLSMENLATQLKDLILGQTPQSLLGYLWGRLLIGTAANEDGDSRVAYNRESFQFALEYVHAVLSCFDGQPEGQNVLEESATKEIIRLAEELKKTTIFYCMVTTEQRDGEFGDETGHVEFNAKTNWVLIRGHRYQVLEEEFFSFILAPHNDTLNQTYGIGSEEIAAGIQDIANSMREGFVNAAEEMHRQMESTHKHALDKGESLKEAIASLQRDMPELATKARAALKDLFLGGLCNLSQHTTLPDTFLQDISYDRGANTEFFELGPLCGTPLRTLPARIKPLVRLDDGYYAPDAQFIRDAAYRAIQRGLLSRVPEYKEEWNRRQKVLTEGAFAAIFHIFWGRNLE